MASNLTTPLRRRSLANLLQADIPPRKLLLSPWLTERHQSLLYGPTGTGKTFVALGIALAVAGGGRFLDWEAPEARRVLFVDGEMDPRELQERCQILLPSVGVDPRDAGENLVLISQQDQEPDTRFPDLGSASGQHVILQHVSDFQPSLVVLDNFSTLFTVEDENSASAMDPVVALLSRLKAANAATILVHHPNKAGASYRGSGKLAVTFDSILALKQPDGGPSRDGVGFRLHWEKLRARHTAATRDREVSFDRGQWESVECFDGPAHTLVDAVRTHRYANQTEIGKALGWTQGYVSKVRQEAIRQGLVTVDEWTRCLDAAREARKSVPEDAELDF